MIEIYFDDVLISEDGYAEITNEYNLFSDTFYLGSVSANTFTLKIAKEYVSSQPSEVRIVDDNTEFHLLVDSIEEDKGFYTYQLTDSMVNFGFNYDAKPLIDNGTTYLQDIWNDICSQAGVDTDYVLQNENIEVGWYDNRIQAREYISFIAELEGGFAYINEDGKLDIKEHNTASQKTITDDEVSEIVIGEEKTINRVVYDNGLQKWEYGSEDITIYIRTDNPFVINEDQIEYVFNKIDGFTFWTVNVPNSIIDTSIRAGDIIIFVKEGVEHKTIAQYSSSFGGGWVGSYSLDLDTERQEETKIIGTVDKVKSIATELDREMGEIRLIADEIADMTDFLKEAEGTGYLQIDNAPESIGAINRLKITGFDLRELYPDMAYPSNYTFPGVLSFYTLIFSPMPITYVETLPTAGFDNYGQIYNEGGLSGKFWKSGASENTQPITTGNELASKILHLEMPSGELSNVDGEQLIAQMTPVSGGVGAFLLYDRTNGIERIFIEQNVMPFVMELYNSDTGWFIEKLFLEDGYAAVNSVNTNAPGYDLITWGDYEWKEYSDDKIKMVYANSPHPLLNDDELVFENNEIKTIQKNVFNFSTNQWESLSQPIEYTLGAVELPTYENETYITMKYFDNVDYWAEYIEDNEFTRNYQTQVESKGQINVSSRQLVLKVDANGHIAETELWADPKTGSRIKLKADDINLEGYTTINDNFKVLLDGSIEANNGKFSGDVIVGNTQLVDKELGLFTTFISSFKANMVMGGAFGRNIIGWQVGFDGAIQFTTSADVFIPDNFIITEAKLFVRGDKTEWHDASSSVGFGVAKNTKLMKSEKIHYNYVISSGFEFVDASYVNTKALGDNGVSVGGSMATEHLVDIDLSHFKKGMNYFTLISDSATPSTPNQAALASTEVVADIQISGYIK